MIRGGETGQALIETALTMSLLILMLVGAADFAQLAYVSIEVSNAAKAAVQYGASSAGAAQDGTGITLAATNDASYLTGLTVPVITTSCTCANPSYTPTSCTDNSTCLNGNTTMLESLTVRTQVTFQPFFHVPVLAQSITLRGWANQMVVGR